MKDRIQDIPSSEIPSLEIIVPCFNERDILADSCSKLSAVLDELLEKHKVSQYSSLVFVDDGSSDNTWQIMQDLCENHSHVKAIKLSRNCGHQNALLAGLLQSSADVTITIDADLQDDISKIEEMLDRYSEGFEVVYGVRAKRDADSLFKRKTATIYYRFLEKIGINIVYNHADFRLLGRKAVDALSEYKEVNLFLRGLIPSLGFSSTSVFYDRKERLQGETKYPTGKMIGFAINGITSHSMFPLRFISVLGILIFFFTVLLSCWVLWITFVDDKAIPGWASSVLPMYLLGGLQLFSLGVAGEYIGKIYLETKHRPRYVIDQTASSNKDARD